MEFPETKGRVQRSPSGTFELPPSVSDALADITEQRAKEVGHVL